MSKSPQETNWLEHGPDECTQKVCQWPVVSFRGNFAFVVWPGSQIQLILTQICRACCSFRRWHSLIAVTKPCCVLIQVHRPGNVLEGVQQTDMHARARTDVQTQLWQRQARQMERQQRAERKYKLKSQCHKEQTRGTIITCTQTDWRYKHAYKKPET